MQRDLIVSLALVVSLGVLPLHAEDRGELIFANDFNRNESQELKEELGNGWTSNSDTRVGGNKQAELRDDSSLERMFCDVPIENVYSFIYIN